LAPVYQLLDRASADEEDNWRFVIADPVQTDEEILGRNTWMVWCGGNEGFWDWLATDSLGFVDLLKLLDTRNRSTRFADAGLMNEPGMVQAGTTAPGEFGLWLDLPVDDRVRDWRRRYVQQTFAEITEGTHKSQRGQDDVYRGGPVTDTPYSSYRDSYEFAEREQSDYSGQYNKYGESDSAITYRDVPPPEFYGLSSGVLGLRLFPNPNFDAEAQERWDAERYYDDEDYYNDPKLVRPYRVGMSCGFCHVSFHPLFPPRDVSDPKWENISGNIGAQYLRIRAVFDNLLDERNFVYHLLDSQPPGTIDTSLIASDNINNPNAMNAVFNLPQRVLVSFRNPKERLSDASVSQPSAWRDPANDLSQRYRQLFEDLALTDEALDSNSNGDESYSDEPGSDQPGSVDSDGEQPDSEPSGGEYANVEASYGEQPADEEREKESDELVETIRIAIGARVDLTKLEAGRKAFARNCIVCQSSIQPETEWAAAFAFGASEVTDEKRAAHEERRRKLAEKRNAQLKQWEQAGEFWEHDPGQWLSDAEYIRWADAVVENANFWRFNYLSTDSRIPINVVQTNSARAVATNAVDGAMWDDFASESYQQMPSVGAIDFFNPYQGEHGGPDQYLPRHATPENVPDGGGGPGFYRVPSLVSIWTTAPLLHNNSLGLFNNDPSVDGRLEAFEDAISKMLWPELRTASSSYNGATPERLERDRGLVWRTPQETELSLAGRYVPAALSREVPWFMKLQERYEWLGEMRPLRLSSALLLLVAFLFLIIDSRKKARAAGIAALLYGAGARRDFPRRRVAQLCIRLVCVAGPFRSTVAARHRAPRTGLGHPPDRYLAGSLRQADCQSAQGRAQAVQASPPGAIEYARAMLPERPGRAISGPQSRKHTGQESRRAGADPARCLRGTSSPRRSWAVRRRDISTTPKCETRRTLHPGGAGWERPSCC
jgi:hypothetical protein